MSLLFPPVKYRSNPTAMNFGVAGDWVECHGKPLRLGFFGEIIMMTNGYGYLLCSKNFAMTLTYLNFITPLWT